MGEKVGLIKGSPELVLLGLPVMVRELMRRGIGGGERCSSGRRSF